MEILPNNEGKRTKEDVYTVNLCNKLHISIKKALILLKLFLFCFYGAGSFITAFLIVYFKQRGVSLAELSTAYMIAPIAQIIGTFLSGIIADKIGRSKPILIVNLALTALTMIFIMLVPHPNYVDCNVQTVNIECDSLFNASVTKIKCDERRFKENICNEKCVLDLSKNCRTQIEKRSTTSKYEKNETTGMQNRCGSEIFTLCICDVLNGTICAVECTGDFDSKCYDEDHRSLLSKVIMLLFILWMTMFSSAYRFSDVTTMHLITKHNADYGKQRLFCLVGTVIISTLAGYLVKITTSVAGKKNYSTAFYFFISLIILCILVVYKLDVQVQPPGKKMAKKAVILLKNPDNLAFAFVLLILGTSFLFTTKFVFWYLEEFQAPSVLIGLLPAVGALYGLPFLFTSDWWMKTFGTTNFLIIGLLGYAICGIGYSFLKNPWMSLLLESLNIVTYHLLWVAVILKSHEIAPEGLSATIISAAGSIHFQLGKTTGSLIARMVMTNFGGPAAYRFLAVMCFAVAFFYSLYLYCRHRYAKKVFEKSNSQDRKSVHYIAG